MSDSLESIVEGTAAARTERPLVSVMTCAYNHDQYITTGIESVLAQTYPNVEMVIVDDGSRDQTAAIAAAFAAAHPDVITLEVHERNRGIPKTFNHALSLCRGEFVAILSSDDYMHEERIEKQVSRFEQAPELSAVHTDVQRVSVAGELIPSETDPRGRARGTGLEMFLVERKRVFAPSVMYRRSALLSIGGADETIYQEDSSIYLGLAKGGFLFDYIDEKLTYYRASEGNASQGAAKRWRDSEAFFRRYVRELPPRQQREYWWLFYSGVFKNAVLGSNWAAAYAVTPSLFQSARDKKELATFLCKVLPQKAAQAALPERGYRTLKRALLRFGA